MAIRDEILDLMNERARQPKTEREALTWLLLLQWVERDFYAVERPKPKITERGLYMANLRLQTEAIRLRAVSMLPQFEVLTQFTLLIGSWKDMTNIAVKSVPGTKYAEHKEIPEIVADAITELIADHMNFSRGYAALSWVKNAKQLSVNMDTTVRDEEADDAGQQESEG